MICIVAWRCGRWSVLAQVARILVAPTSIHHDNVERYPAVHDPDRSGRPRRFICDRTSMIALSPIGESL